MAEFVLRRWASEGGFPFDAFWFGRYVQRIYNHATMTIMLLVGDVFVPIARLRPRCLRHGIPARDAGPSRGRARRRVRGQRRHPLQGPRAVLPTNFKPPRRVRRGSSRHSRFRPRSSYIRCLEDIPRANNRFAPLLLALRETPFRVTTSLQRRRSNPLVTMAPLANARPCFMQMISSR